MSLNVNAKSYTADGWDSNSVRFQGPLNTVSVVDRLLQKVTSPKPTAEFSGMARFQVRLTRTLALTGAKTASGLATCDTTISVPVGTADADRDAICADIGAYFASAAFKAALKALQPNG